MRAAGLAPHRRRIFSSRRPSEGALKAATAGMSIQDLHWTAYLPDHSREAKTFLRDELIKRGAAEATHWLPTAAEVTVPAAYPRPLSPRTYGRLSALRWAIIRGFHVVAVVALLLLVAFLAAGVAFQTPPDLEEATWIEQQRFFGDALLTNSFIGVYQALRAALVLIVVLTLMAVCLFPRCNRRILLLRPFGDKKMTKPLKAMVSRTLGRSGYVFTLSDRGYRPMFVLSLLSFLVNAIAVFVLNPVFRNTVRIISVKRERHFRALQRFLLRRFRPCLMSFLSCGQAFNIRCTDVWWQASILTLMHSCDAVVIDLSCLKAGTDWELEQLKRAQLLGKCVFVIGEEYRASTYPSLEKHFDRLSMPVIHVYDRRGRFESATPFTAELENLLARAPELPHVPTAQNTHLELPRPSPSAYPLAARSTLPESSRATLRSTVGQTSRGAVSGPRTSAAGRTPSNTASYGFGGLALLFLFGIWATYMGSSLTIDAIRYPEPVALSCDEFLAKPPSARWVKLSGCTMDYHDALWSFRRQAASNVSASDRDRIEDIYVPLRSKAADPAPVQVIVRLSQRAIDPIQQLLSSEPTAKGDSPERHVVQLMARHGFGLVRENSTVQGMTETGSHRNAIGRLLLLRSEGNWTPATEWIEIIDDVAPSWRIGLALFVFGVIELVWCAWSLFHKATANA